MEFKSFLFDYQQYQKEESNSYFDQNVLIGGIMGEHVNIGLKSRFSFGVDYSDDTQQNKLDDDNNSNNSDNDDQYNSGSIYTSTSDDDEYSGSSNDESDEEDDNDKENDKNNNNKYKQNNNSGQLSLSNNWFVNTFFKKQQQDNIQEQEKEKEKQQKQEEKEIRQLNKLNELEEIKLKKQLGESFVNILKQPTPNNIGNSGILEKMILQQSIIQSPIDSLIRESSLDTIKKIQQQQQKQDTYTITSPFSSSTSSSPLSTSTNSSTSSSCCTSDNDDEYQHNNTNNTNNTNNSNNQQDDIKCIDCLNTITQMNDIIFLDCTHIYCRNCLNNFIRKRIEEKRVSKIKCKSCKTLLSEFDIKQVLDTEEDISKYDMASLDQVISKNKDSYIQCPCCNLFMEKVIVPLVKSTIGGKSKLNNNSNNKIEYDEQGKPLSRESIEHKRKFRFRCPQCSTIFCTECKVHPYHLGFTCAQFQIYNSSKHCRFCKIAIYTTTTPTILSPRSPRINNNNNNLSTTTTTTTTTKLNYNNNNNICFNEECILKSIKSCDKTLACGHECNGIINESKCLPCIHPDCEYFHSTTPGNDDEQELYRTNQKSNDYCNICWTDSLSSEPCIQLECGHIFHRKCCSSILKKKWTSSRISFGFIKCALCTQNMKHPSLDKHLTPINELYNQVLTKSLQRCDIYGVEKGVDFDDPSSKWYNNKQGYAMNRFSYYMCFKCKKPYFGGDQRMCGDGEGNGNGGKEFKAEELICGGCSSTSGEQGCKAHQKQFIEYKCFYCCSVAVFFCFGKTRFCDKCHEQNQALSLVKIHPPCPAGPGGIPLESTDGKCPLGLPSDHKNGVEMSLGCRICREDL